MTRSNYSPSAGSTITDKLKVYEGGLGVADAASARAALGVIALSSLGQPNGIAQLGADGLMSASQIPDDAAAPISVQGPTVVTIGSTNTYQMTNFDIFTTYTIVPIGTGVVSLTGSVITYNAPAVAEAGGFIINGRAVNITVQGIQPQAPTLTGVDVFGGPAGLTLTGSAFAMTSGTNTHLNSDWQIATDSAFTTVVKSSMADATNKTTWTGTGLNLSTTYYARVRYRDNANTAGSWSNTLTLTTKSTYAITIEESKFIAGSDKSTNDAFGNCISANSDGSRVVIGIPKSFYTSLSNAGAAYVFKRTGTTWAVEGILAESDAATGDYFGTSVTINADGSRIAIGARLKNGGTTTSGVVYVFLRTGTTWAQEQKITPTTPVGGAHFGSAVSLNSDATRLAVGAEQSNKPVSSSGSAYIFLRTGTTWTQEALIASTDGLSLDYFGYSISLSGDGIRVAVGAKSTAGAGGQNASGAVYVFTRSGTTWTQEKKLTASIQNDTANFGWSVAINYDGSRIVSGAINDLNNSSSVTGVAYVYSRTGTTWIEEQKIINPGNANGGQFGSSVAISDNGSRIAIGAFNEINATWNAGAVFVFSRNNTTWTQESKLLASDPNPGMNFGYAVSISNDGTRIFVGANAATVAGLNACGAAYVYR